MTTSSVSVPNTGTTKVATHTIAEDGDTKHLERMVPSTSTGAEILPATEAKQDTGNTALAAIQSATESIRDANSTVQVALDSASVYSGSTALTPKFAAISSTDDGDTVALVSGKKIRVLSMFFVVAGATTVKFQSGATTDKTGAMSFAANGGISLPFNPVGWFETVAGEKLNHVLGSAVAIAGGLTYVEV